MDIPQKPLVARFQAPTTMSIAGRLLEGLGALPMSIPWSDRVFLICRFLALVCGIPGRVNPTVNYEGTVT